MNDVIIANAMSLEHTFILIPDVQWALCAYMIPAILRYVLG
jgi:hypothetical protein